MRNTWHDMMSLGDVLSIWSKVCESASVSWYLYREALLCAEGYHMLSGKTESVNVVVFASDLLKLKKSVLPRFPKDWCVGTLDIAVDQAPLVIKKDEKVILQIDVLWPVENENKLNLLGDQLNKIRSKSKKILRNVKFLRVFFGLNGERLLARSLKKASQKAFDEMCILAAKTDRKAVNYSDILTNIKFQFWDAHFFSKSATITCKEGTYPVFHDYKEYLKKTYGDYEDGLTDSIGVGLTAEEKNELKNHQRRCKEALAFLQALAQKYRLRYYLLAGSVLGPVRDGGFIPWDDDIDVGIRVEDLDQFEARVKEHLPKSLPKGFELVQSEANNPYPRMFSKICYEGRCCIDLWPLVPTYVKGIRAIFTWYFAKIITKAHYYKIGCQVKNFLELVKPMCLFLSDKQIMALARHNERKYVNKKTDAYINLYSIYRREKETIKREWLDTPATRDFDGLEVPVVGCTEQYLEHLYGDYMSKPAPWKRASRHVERFSSKEYK